MIAEAFRDKTLFITGTTGFLGKFSQRASLLHDPSFLFFLKPKIFKKWGRKIDVIFIRELWFDKFIHIGKVVLEKLMFSIRDFKKMYVLIRPKVSKLSLTNQKLSGISTL